LYKEVVEITSRENPACKELKQVAGDNQSNYMLVEGKKLFLEIINSGLKIKKIFVQKNSWENFSRFLPDAAGIEIIYMTNDLLSSLYTTESKPDNEELIISLVEKPLWKLKDLFKLRKNIVFLEGIQDPGNLGTIIRSVLAFEAAGIVLSKNSVNPFNTKVIRASAGAVFKTPILFAEDNSDFINCAKNETYKIVATSSKLKQKNNELEFSMPSVFMFGNEGSGLSQELLSVSDDVIMIPHSDKVESLNIAISASLILWQTYKKK